EVIPIGTYVVIHHVEDHADSRAVGAIYEAAEIIGTAVDSHRREVADAIIAPSEPAWKIGYRHNLYDGYARARQFGQLAARRLECAFGCECADVHLVNHLSWERDAVPVLIIPVVLRRVHDLRRAMRSLWLKARRRIGEAVATIQAKAVKGAGGGLGDEAGVIAVGLRM